MDVIVIPDGSDTKSGFKMPFILESAQADFDCIAAVSTAKQK
jgi:hypothetical protein